MNFKKIAIAATAVSLLTTAASAAAPALGTTGFAAQPTVQLGSNARANSAKSGRHSELAGAALPLAIVGVAAVGVGIAAAAGAFKSNHHNSASQ
jgi:hypothetical protein